ncbi:MAG TPA: 3-phosphoshikimate 1-carboxyvinyltransferase, partial [Gemmatimonadales bacterium]|nr:3-phosphoshikimate 1-carboxyvinyltransferase [Gemmatimonadales bacterium]
LAALAGGRSHIGGALTSFDARSTARVLRQLGAAITPLTPGRVVEVTGRRRFARPGGTLHCGNSGTTTRLLLGMLAGHAFAATVTGDASLRRRPMRRVTVPLARMGAKFIEPKSGEGLPLTVRGGRLVSLSYEQPVSSAQIKSSLLLAGMVAGVEVDVREPHGRSRDHTERMLRAFEYVVIDDADGWIRFRPTGRLTPFELQVPGDPSSAAFLVGAALLAEGGELHLGGVGVNPTRIGFLDVLARMGATIRHEGWSEEGGEPVADLLVAPAALRGTEVAAAEIPGLIDEIPLLAVVASRAEGTTVFRQVGELRVKESDRLGLIAENLRAVGVAAEVQGEDLYVTGTDRPPRGKVRTAHDHRLAMAFGVLGTVPGAKVAIDDKACAGVSFPGFWDLLRKAAK